MNWRPPWVPEHAVDLRWRPASAVLALLHGFRFRSGVTRAWRLWHAGMRPHRWGISKVLPAAWERGRRQRAVTCPRRQRSSRRPAKQCS